jgi:hypothetical protein
MHRWWSDDPIERFWMEITDRDEFLPIVAVGRIVYEVEL